jgi:hypothetical protein
MAVLPRIRGVSSHNPEWMVMGRVFEYSDPMAGPGSGCLPAAGCVRPSTRGPREAGHLAARAGRRWTVASLLLGSGALGLGCCWGVRSATADDTKSAPLAAPNHLKAGFQVSFHDSGSDPWLGVEPRNELMALLRFTPDGLRISVPLGTKGRNIGVYTRFGVRGDFEITASYEILAVSPTKEGSGVGPELYVRSDKGWGDFVGMARYVRDDLQGGIISSVHGRKVDGKPTYQGEDVPATNRAGKFRIVRNGPTVNFLVAEGKDERFREVHRCEFGRDDINMVRLSAIFRGSGYELDLLWHDLTIRAEELPGWYRRESMKGQRTLFFWINGVLVVVIVAGLLGYHRWQMRQPLESEPRPLSD